MYPGECEARSVLKLSDSPGRRTKQSKSGDRMGEGGRLLVERAQDICLEKRQALELDLFPGWSLAARCIWVVSWERFRVDPCWTVSPGLSLHVPPWVLCVSSGPRPTGSSLQALALKSGASGAGAHRLTL